MKCRDCKYNGFLSEDGNQFNWCFRFNDNLDINEERQCSGFAPASNADCIRAMTDGELATILAEAECPSDLGGKDKCKDGTTDFRICWECWLEWLRQEAHDEP